MVAVLLTLMILLTQFTDFTDSIYWLYWPKVLNLSSFWTLRTFEELRNFCGPLRTWGGLRTWGPCYRHLICIKPYHKSLSQNLVEERALFIPFLISMTSWPRPRSTPWKSSFFFITRQSGRGTMYFTTIQQKKTYFPPFLCPPSFL